MPTFDVDPERITVFRTADGYVFSHYFERDDLFEALREYYDEESYRFEVPAEEFGEVADRLADAHYEPRVIEDLEPYCVVTEKYAKHADVLRNSVANWERRGHRFFLMKDELAVKEAIEAGAEPLEDTDFVMGI